MGIQIDPLVEYAAEIVALRAQIAAATAAGDSARAATLTAELAGRVAQLIPDAAGAYDATLDSVLVRRWSTGATYELPVGAFRGFVDVRDHGAIGDGVTDDAAAITAAIAAGTVVRFPAGSYKIGSAITVPGGKLLIAEKAILLKAFDGVGLTFTGASDYSFVDGDLEVRGSGAFAATGAIASTSPNAHGIVISGSRVRVRGALRGNNHQGNGVYFTATGNANKSDLQDLWATGNAENGIRFAGTQDDASVWRVGLYAQSNRKAGVLFDTDFSGRNWQGFIYAESNASDLTSNQVDIGKLRSSSLSIYAEMGSGAGVELAIGQNCTELEIEDWRSNLTTVHADAAATCRTYTGGRQRVWGLQTGSGELKLTDVNNNPAKWSDFNYRTSEGIIATDRVRGDRRLQRTVMVPTEGARTATMLAQTASQVLLESYGQEAGDLVTRWNGTIDAPTTLVANDVVYRKYFIAGLASLASKISASFRAVVGTITASKASLNLIWATTPDGASAAVDTFQVGYDGNIEVLQNGKGIRLRQPNGTIRLLTVSDAGALVIT